VGADASRAARCVCSAAPCVCFHGGVGGGGGGRGAPPPPPPPPLAPAAPWVCFPGGGGGGTARRAATQQQHTRIMPMAAPTAMVASQRPMTAPSVGPPPLNGVHSPPAPLKCPAVQRAPSGRNGEASTSCSWPLSKPKPSCSSQALHAFLPGSAEHRRAVGECKGVAACLSSPPSSPEPQSQD
jgi:hypothetical protein